jgi:hypothetical protein
MRRWVSGVARVILAWRVASAAVKMSCGTPAHQGATATGHWRWNGASPQYTMSYRSPCHMLGSKGTPKQECYTVSQNRHARHKPTRIALFGHHHQQHVLPMLRVSVPPSAKPHTSLTAHCSAQGMHVTTCIAPRTTAGAWCVCVCMCVCAHCRRLCRTQPKSNH